MKYTPGTHAVPVHNGNSERISKDFWLGTAVALLLSLLAEKFETPLVKILCLIGVLGSFTIPIWHLDWVHRAVSIRRRVGRFVVGMLPVLLVVVIVGLYVWPQTPIVIRVTFQDSPLFTSRREDHITRVLNEYYRYLTTDIGIDLPPELPPIGISPRGGPIVAGGEVGAPPYYSHIILSEDSLDNDGVLRSAYSTYVFNRLLSPVYINDRPLAEANEESAWIFMCYFPASFGGKAVCAADVPGNKWIGTLWEVRSKFGKPYSDKLLSFTLRMWATSPAGQWKTTDQFFANKLLAGEVVMNAGGDRFQAIRDIAQRHGMQLD